MHNNIEDVIVLPNVLDPRISSQVKGCILFRVIGFRRDLPEMEYSGAGLRVHCLGRCRDNLLHLTPARFTRICITNVARIKRRDLPKLPQITVLGCPLAVSLEHVPRRSLPRAF